MIMAKKTITNIIDYLIWRGDLTFAQDHFNEVDALVLSRFSYMDMKDILYNDKNGMTVAKAYELYSANIAERPKFHDQDPELFRLMAGSLRFGDLMLMYHDFRFDDDSVEQFSTITIKLADERYFLSFRGTDDTINGWKEDSPQELLPFLQSYWQMGVTQVLCTDISRDGMLSGPSVGLYRSLLEANPACRLIASGGVSSIGDLWALDEAGVPAVVVGKAIYEGRVDLAEALKALK